MAQPAGPDQPAFVLHDHRRPRPHFDLRLEENGVLRSWAVPRGLPESPTADRLAVAVDDHDLDHLTYTDADKSVADTGWWQEHDRTERRLLFTLHGRRTSRRYALIRTDRDWLLHLTKDQPAAAAAPRHPPGEPVA
jgi:DNA ligase D-like protein (predicted 3'-phosphoesterase)